MSEEIDQGRRKFVFHRLPLIAGAVLFVPSLLIPSGAQASDFEYELYKLPSDDQLRKFTAEQERSRKYLGELRLFYEVPPNKDKNGNRLTGNFTFTSNPESTSIQILLSHPNEHRLITLSEIRSGDSIRYNESEINYLKPGEGFNNSFVFKAHERVATPVSLARTLVLGHIPETSFLFQGRREKSKRYSLEIKTKKIDKLPAVKNDSSDEEIEKMGLTGLEAKIKENSPRISSGKVIYRKIDGFNIPVEIDLEYSVKIMSFGIFRSNYDDHTIKGVLSV